MRRIAPLLLTLAACAALPTAAHAAGTLTVQKNVARGGTVTAGGKIDCGTSCTSASAHFANFCSEGICEPQDVAVFAEPQSGWSVAYAGCTDEGEGSCSVYMSTSRTVTVTFTDVEDPVVAMGGPGAGSAVRGTINLAATATDNDSVSRVEFSVGGAKLGEDTTVPYTLPVDTTALGDGSRSFSVKAFDASGRESATASRTLTVDNTKPGVAITAGPANGTLVPAPGDVSYAFAGTDATSGVAQMQCGLDGGSIVACDSATAHALSGVAEGHQKFLVRAVDEAGNAGDWAQRTFTVDKTRPAVSITSGPADGAIVGKPGVVTYAFTASDANGATVTCGVGGAFGPCSDAGGHTLSGLSDGLHAFSVKAVDGAGNQTVVTRSVRIDITAPTVTITDGPADGAVIDTGVAQFHWMVHDESPGLGGIACAEDGGAFASCDGISSHDMWGIADGAHSFSVRIIDSAGNATTVTRTFTVDTTAPDTSIDSFAGGVFAFSASEGGTTFRCRIYKAGAVPSEFGDCSGPSSHGIGSLPPGDYLFEVVATDGLGHADATPARKAFTVPASGAGTPGPGTPGTGTPGTGSPGTGTPGTPGTETPGTPGMERIVAGVTSKWHNRRGRTRAVRLLIRDIPAGATVEVRCKGKGCPFATKAFPHGKATLDLAKALKRKRLGAGATLEVRVVKPGAVAWVKVFKMRRKGRPVTR